MANLLGSNSMLETQQYSDIASLGSKLDCSWVVDHSDSHGVGTHIHFFHCLQLDSPSTSAHMVSGLPSRNLITQKILDQLQVIGNRIDNLEKANMKKKQMIKSVLVLALLAKVLVT